MLPASQLSATIQQDGQLDLLLRAIEDERATAMAAAQQQDHLFEAHYQDQAMFSDFWIGRVYETLRLLIARGLLPKDGDVGALKQDFNLLRIPIDKHEIAGDGSLTEPLHMQRQPPSGNATDFYEYNKADPQRAHIMGRGVSQRGSMMWRTVDLKTRQDRWIERRALSDRIIALWGADDAAGKSAAVQPR